MRSPRPLVLLVGGVCLVLMTYALYSAVAPASQQEGQQKAQQELHIIPVRSLKGNLEAEIRRIQHPEGGCKALAVFGGRQRALIVNAWHGGLAAKVQQVAVQQMAAYLNDRVAVLNGTSWEQHFAYGRGPECDPARARFGHSFSCFFEHFSSCHWSEFTALLDQAGVASVGVPFEWDDDAPVAVWDVAAAWPSAGTYETSMHAAQVPGWSARGLGWFFGMFEAYVFRPNHQVLEYVHAHRREQAMPPEGYDVSMHVRRGDKQNDPHVTVNRAHAFTKYHALALHSVGTLSGIKTAFIASDDPDVLREAARATHKHDVRYYALPRPSAAAMAAAGGAGQEAATFLFSHPALAYAHTLEVITDVLELARASHFIGTCLSQVSRLAAGLALSSGRLEAAPIALDARECMQVWHYTPVLEGWVDGAA